MIHLYGDRLYKTYMYNISDLESMAEGDIKKVAEELGLKKIDSTDKQELIYRILDEQAIVGAATRAARRREATPDKAEPKKRGRKKKVADAVEPAEAAAPAVEAAAAPEAAAGAEATAGEPAEATVGQPKRRRGRPSKKELAERMTSETPAETTEAAPEVKTAQVDEEPVAADAPVAEAEPDDAPAPAEVSAQEQPREMTPRYDFHPKGDFSSFFPRGEGRKFVPRSRQEKEQPLRPQRLLVLVR